MAAIPSHFDRRPDVSPASNPTVSHLKLVMPDTATLDSLDTHIASVGLPTPAPGFRRLEPTPELFAELHEASQRLETASPEEIIAWGVERYAPFGNALWAALTFAIIALEWLLRRRWGQH